MIEADSGRGAALVTGAARGVGYAIVQGLRESGWVVAGLDADATAIDAARAANPDVEWLTCDIGDSASVDRAFGAVRARIGAIGLLVNNAGIAGPTALVEDIEDLDWERTMSVNLTGAFRLIRAAVPDMKQARRGAIVNIITTSVKTGLPHRLAYIASKGGLLAMTETLARELGPFNVRCNCVSPGLVNNDRGRRVLEQQAQLAGKPLEEFEEEVKRFISMRCWVEPEEIADAVAFLASDRARHITNQHISVCGNSEWE